MLLCYNDVKVRLNFSSQSVLDFTRSRPWTAIFVLLYIWHVPYRSSYNLHLSRYWLMVFVCPDYYVEWNGHWIHVFRPDVECTNGIIHVIDEPFVLESDIRATGSADNLQIANTFFLLLASCLFVRVLEF